MLLLAEHRADAVGRLAAGAGVPEVADEALDLAEREADGLQLDDPVDAIDGVLAVQPEPAVGPRLGLEETELFVEVHGTDGLTDRLCQLAYAEQLVVCLWTLGLSHR
jgi:hypothetical protein